MSEQQPIIQFCNVTKKRQERVIISDVSFTISHQTLTLIQGPSGSGKSTILLMIAGFERVDSGSIMLNERDVDSPTEYVQPNKRGVSLQFQGLALWPHLTALEQIRFVMGDHAEKDPVEYARLVGFPSLKLQKYPMELSGGERQRLALARTIASPSEILLFDEPFNNLDGELRGVVIDLLHELSKLRTVVVVSHDLFSLNNTLRPQATYLINDQRLEATASLVDPLPHIA